MKRVKKPTQNQAELLAEAAKHFEKIGEKQIIGHVRISHPGQPAVNRYTLEDGAEILEDDDGNPIQEWPELPPHVVAKRAAK